MAYEITLKIRVDGKHTKVESISPMMNLVGAVQNPEQHKQDQYTAAHLMSCSACGLAGSVGAEIVPPLPAKMKVKKSH